MVKRHSDIRYIYVCVCVNLLCFHKEAEDIPDEVFEGRVIGSPCWTRREMRTF